MKRSKKIILSLVAFLLIGVIMYMSYLWIHYFSYDKYKKSFVSYQYETGNTYTALSDQSDNVIGMELVAENDYLKLYTNPKTTEVAVYDKRTGETTYSNPLNRDQDAVAEGTNKAMLNSQLVIDYYDSNRTIATMNSYELSTEKNQFKVESIKNGIRYIYTFGDLSSATGIVPVYIKEERLKTLVLDKLSDKDAKTVKGKYSESKKIKGFLELATGATKSRLGMKKLNDIFAKAGYTENEFNEDKKAAMGDSAEALTFTIPLEYRLEDESLVVTIPTSKIKETGEGKIASIQLLKFFGAGSATDKGYMLVPNGSGSLIYFNNGKKNDQYNQYLYGMDPVSMGFYIVESTEKARLPIFGLKKENTAIFASIESGDSVSNVIADVAGKLNSYNYVYPTFYLREGQKLSMFGTTGASSELPVVEKNYYKLDLTVRYSFLEKKDASYSGMANYYRNELKEKGILKVKEENNDIPFYLDILGGVQKIEYLAGKPYRTAFPMTTFKEANEIANEFFQSDINNIHMNFSGWFNRGYYHDVTDQINVIKKLGSKDDLEDLNKNIEKNGGKLYADVAFQKVPFTSKRFNYKLESSRYYTGMVVNYGKINPATLRQTSSLGGYNENLYNVLSPKYLVRYIEKFSDKITDYSISGIALRDLADILQSDKKRSELINREQAKYIVKDQLKKLQETNKDLMLEGGNYYALEYASDLINVPTSANQFYIVDEEVPFYEMVVHGCIDYAGDSINFNDSYDKNMNLLRMLEYGAAPHFTFSYKSPTNIKYTGMKEMYATFYKDWIDDAKELYKGVNDALKLVSNSEIINHEKLSDSVVKVTYSNGVAILINKGNKIAFADGKSIEAYNYVLEGVEE